MESIYLGFSTKFIWNYSYISTYISTLADRYIMHIRVRLISSLSCQVSCVHQFFSCAWMCKHKKAVAPCGAILIRPFSGHWVRIFNGKQNVNVWIMRPNISDINSRCYVAWNPLNWPPDTAHANRRHFESGRNWQLRPPVVPRGHGLWRSDAFWDYVADRQVSDSAVATALCNVMQRTATN